MQDIDDIIKSVNEEDQSKVDWTKAWSKKYPILGKYQKEVDIPRYSGEIRKLLVLYKFEWVRQIPYHFCVKSNRIC